jgi:hypothetical protein
MQWASGFARRAIPGGAAEPLDKLRTLDQAPYNSIEIVRFCAFAPPDSPLDQYTSLIITAKSRINFLKIDIARVEEWRCKSPRS